MFLLSPAYASPMQPWLLDPTAVSHSCAGADWNPIPVFSWQPLFPAALAPHSALVDSCTFWTAADDTPGIAPRRSGAFLFLTTGARCRVSVRRPLLLSAGPSCWLLSDMSERAPIPHEGSSVTLHGAICLGSACYQWSHSVTLPADARVRIWLCVQWPPCLRHTAAVYQDTCWMNDHSAIMPVQHAFSFWTYHCQTTLPCLVLQPITATFGILPCLLGSATTTSCMPSPCSLCARWLSGVRLVKLQATGPRRFFLAARLMVGNGHSRVAGPPRPVAGPLCQQRPCLEVRTYSHLQATRVGEAQNPGPQSDIRRFLAAAPCTTARERSHTTGMQPLAPSAEGEFISSAGTDAALQSQASRSVPLPCTTLHVPPTATDATFTLQSSTPPRSMVKLTF